MSTTCPSETFRVSILSGPLLTQRRQAMVLRPKPSNRYAREHRRPTSPSKSMPHSKGTGASRFPGRLTVLRRNHQSACRPSPGPGLDHHSPGALQPADRPSVYLSRTPAPTTTGPTPSSGWPLFRGLHLHSPPSSGWRAFILPVDNHSSSLGAMRPTLFRMAPQSSP